LYFPRHPSEEAQATQLLPEDTGSLNELGETVISERKIRIGAVPQPEFISMPKPIDDGVPDGERKSALTEEMKKAFNEPQFINMSENPDDVRRKLDSQKPKKQLQEEEANRQYSRYLRRAKEEDLSDMAKLNFIYQSGVDSQGRAIIVFIASHMPAQPAENLDRILLYMIQVLDPIVVNDYNVIFFHTHVQSKNKPPLPWLKTVYGIFNRKYKKNLRRLFIVHPNFWIKMVLWFVNPFVKKKFWKKMKYVPRLYDLYEFFEPKQLIIPEKILKYDQDHNGEYYAPPPTEGKDGDEDAQL